MVGVRNSQWFQKEKKKDKKSTASKPNKERVAWSSGVELAPTLPKPKPAVEKWQFENPLIKVDIATGEAIIDRLQDTMEHGYQPGEGVKQHGKIQSADYWGLRS